MVDDVCSPSILRRNGYEQDLSMWRLESIHSSGGACRIIPLKNKVDD